MINITQPAEAAQRAEVKLSADARDLQSKLTARNAELEATTHTTLHVYIHV